MDFSQVESDDLKEEIFDLKNQMGDLKAKLKDVQQDHQVKLAKLEQSGKMSDGQLDVFTQTWNSICAKLDASQLDKFKE